MKTEREVEILKEVIQKKIDEVHNKALSENCYQDAEKWWDCKRQLMAQYNILLEVLK